MCECCCLHCGQNELQGHLPNTLLLICCYYILLFSMLHIVLHRILPSYFSFFFLISPSLTARDLLSKTLVPDPAARIKLSEMKNHPWMQHADSGPEPSKGDNSAATAGAPPVSNVPSSASNPSVPTPPAAKKETPKAPAAAAQPPTPPVAAAAPAKKSPTPAPAATAAPTPAASPAPAAAAPAPAKTAPVKDEGENVGGGGFFGCCGSSNRHYDQV